MLSDEEIKKLKEWTKSEMDKGNRSKASRIFKILKRHYLAKWTKETEETLIFRIKRGN